VLKAVLMLSMAFAVAAPARGETREEPKRWIKTPTGYLVVLRRGDNVIERLERLASEEKIPSASLTGIGFFREVTFGFYDFDKKAFDPQTFNDVEAAGMSGSIAWKDGKPSIHAHATVAGRDFQAVGGHILAAEVGTGSCEITVIVHDAKLERKLDPEIGANVLQLGE
jgi:predicted DNA-binding protein with PD1-like motif